MSPWAFLHEVTSGQTWILYKLHKDYQRSGHLTLGRWQFELQFLKVKQENRIEKSVQISPEFPSVIKHVTHYRRHVQLKKVTGKHILKSTLTPKLARKQTGGRTSGQTSLSGPSGTGSTSISSIPSTSSVSKVCTFLSRIWLVCPPQSLHWQHVNCRNIILIKAQRDANYAV